MFSTLDELDQCLSFLFYFDVQVSRLADDCELAFSLANNASYCTIRRIPVEVHYDQVGH